MLVLVLLILMRAVVRGWLARVHIVGVCDIARSIRISQRRVALVRIWCAAQREVCGAPIVVFIRWLVLKSGCGRIVIRICARVLMVRVWLIVCRHGGIIDGALIVREVLVSLQNARRWPARVNRGSVVEIIVQRDIWQGRLWEGLVDELAFLVHKVREIASSFFPSEISSPGQTLLVASFDNLRNTLADKNMSANSPREAERRLTLSTLWQQYS